MWLIIRIVIGKSQGVEDTREIPKESEKGETLGKVTNGKVVANGDPYESTGDNANHGKGETFFTCPFMP